jgi:hypothetical protein
MLRSAPALLAAFTLLFAPGCGANSDGEAIALRGSQITWLEPNDELDLGGPIPRDQPDTLYVLLGSDGRSCDDPFIESMVNDLDCSTFWRVELALPPPRQTAGPIGLGSAEIANGFTRIREDASGGCVVTGGAFTLGSLEILSIDEQHVSLKIQGASNAGTGLPPPGFSPDGTYTAKRCP